MNDCEPALAPLQRLQAVLQTMDRAGVAVSGGVDSLTLAEVAHRVFGPLASMHHATSPAVPAAATHRTRALAAARGWSLDVFDAGEFERAEYRANPVDRCFFCKTSLYGSIARRTTATMISGTNLDDLGEYRPGLQAARDHAVRHPFVEAGIDKAGVRILAAHLGLGDVADLPASPCLSSRVETGIAIDARTLRFIERAEMHLRDRLARGTVRCRVRATGIVVELDAVSLGLLDDDARHDVQRALQVLAREAGLQAPIAFAAYRNGSAFLRTGAA